MAKKIEMTKEEQELYSELRLLVKRANQRILRIERLVGEKGTFDVKQLYDYLSASTIQGITNTGRVRVLKSNNVTQMLAIKKALDDFLEEGSLSSIKNIKEKTKEYSIKLGKPLSYLQADTLYQTGKNYRWIIGMNGLTESEFWGTWVLLAKRGTLDQEEWGEQIALRIKVEIDDYYKSKLEALYLYVRGD